MSTSAGLFRLPSSIPIPAGIARILPFILSTPPEGYDGFHDDQLFTHFLTMMQAMWGISFDTFQKRVMACIEDGIITRGNSNEEDVLYEVRLAVGHSILLTDEDLVNLFLHPDIDDDSRYLNGYIVYRATQVCLENSYSGAQTDQREYEEREYEEGEDEEREDKGGEDEESDDEESEQEEREDDEREHEEWEQGEREGRVAGVEGEEGEDFLARTRRLLEAATRAHRAKERIREGRERMLMPSHATQVRQQFYEGLERVRKFA